MVTQASVEPQLIRSLGARVYLDRPAGTATKVYAPTVPIRLLYWLAFQASFPYARGMAALAAAEQRRRIVSLLTTYWYGEDLVAPVLEIDCREDGCLFITRLIEGSEPRDRKRARRFLKELTQRFIEAGLPTWQVTPYNPRAVDNLIERFDGSYRIIDLESNLVAPLHPVSRIIGAIRQGNFPAFDDIDIERLQTYLAQHRTELLNALGEEGETGLLEAKASYIAAVSEWRAGEPRLLSRGLRFLLGVVDVPSWVRGLRRIKQNARGAASQFVEQGIEDWSREGLLSSSEEADLRSASNAPAVAYAMTHLGAHLGMSIPLRFPLGSLARFGWTLAMRVKAEWAALFRKQPAESARVTHTLLVAFAGLIPGLGAGAYLLSKPLRSNPGLAAIALDRFLRKLPWRAYSRLHLAALTTWLALPRARPRVERERVSLKRLRTSLGFRLRGLTRHRGLVGLTLAINVGILALGGSLYLAFDSRFVFEERGVMASTDALQLLAGGLAGMLAFTAFWSRKAVSAPREEAAGIFFWAISGLGLVGLALEDFFAVHENLGAWIEADYGGSLFFTKSAGDVFVLAYALLGLALLYTFRQEVFARRSSSTLLMAGVAAAAAMVAIDTSDTGPLALKALEYPAQALAAGFLMTAYVTRWIEVRTPEGAASHQRPASKPESIDAGGIWTIPSSALVEAVIRRESRDGVTEAKAPGVAAGREAELTSRSQGRGGSLA